MNDNNYDMKGVFFEKFCKGLLQNYIIGEISETRRTYVNTETLRREFETDYDDKYFTFKAVISDIKIEISLKNFYFYKERHVKNSIEEMIHACKLSYKRDINFEKDKK